MFKRFVPLIPMVIALCLSVQPLSAQHSRGQRGGNREGQGRGDRGRERGDGQAEPRRQPPQGGQRAQGRQPHDREMHEYAVPRRQPLPRPREGYGAYGRVQYRGHIFFWRPYPVIWITANTCVPGYWDWDPWYGGWVWVQGYCNVPGFRPYAGFYFWFDGQP